MVVVITDLSVLLSAANKHPLHDLVDFMERVIKHEGCGKVNIFPYGTYNIAPWNDGEREVILLHLKKMRKRNECRC